MFQMGTAKSERNDVIQVEIVSRYRTPAQPTESMIALVDVYSINVLSRGRA